MDHEWLFWDVQVVRPAFRPADLRIVGELKGLGVVVSAATVKKVLSQERLGPARQAPRSVVV
jgi:hypothetical protein